MHKILKFSFLLLLSFLITSCFKTADNNLEADNNQELEALNDGIRKFYAPDKRVALYNVNLVSKNGKLEILGESDQSKAVDSLTSALGSKGIAFVNHVVILPDSSVGNTAMAIVNNAVANIRSQPKHSGELATQALLGTELKVLKIVGDFYLVQTPDAYISWVDHGGVTLMNSGDYQQWQDSQKIIYTKAFGSVYQNPSDELHKAGDIVLGAQLRFLEDDGSFYKVAYPDKRTGYIKKSESDLYTHWIGELDPSAALVELYAKELMGIPYLWGGTSSKGMDCSGFTKTVFLMNGYIIPRDASQQIMAGKDIDPEVDFSNLKKGDLMFFGKKATDSTKQRVTHVGIWLDNNQGEFIHSSGRVKMGSIDPNSTYYDENNKSRYLGSRRYLDQKDKMIINLKEESFDKNIKT